MKFSNTTGYAVFNISRQWKKTAMIICMDVLLLGILFAAAKLFDYFFVSNESLFVGTWLGYGFLLAYFLIVVAAYSFFKYAILQLLNSQQCEIKITKNIFYFYLYNLMLLAGLGMLFIMLTTFFTVSLITMLKQVAVVVFVVLYGLASYFFVSGSHVFFVTENPPLKEISHKVYNTLSWRGIAQWLGWNTVFFIIFFIAYVLLYMILQTMTENILLFFSMNLLMFAVLLLEAYFLLFWNRTYLFLTVKSTQNRDKIVPQPLKKK